jgi:hypothetical protein
MNQILAIITVSLAEFIVFGVWFVSLGPRTGALSRPAAYVIGVGTIIAAYTLWLFLMPVMPGRWCLVGALVWFSVVGALWPVAGRFWIKWQEMQEKIAIFEVRDE